ncbi:MAG: hypothetical protein LBC02_13720 [Planctomycetaceae bacterium]|jgi:ankyrin repeat protein|nr:hypothetical protein [Planctomycetaceae bacterium]
MGISDKELQERNRRTSIEIVREIEKSPKFGHFAVGNAFAAAAMSFLQEELERMLSAGVDVNIRREDGYTAIMVANDIRIIRFLLSKGADPNLVNMRGESTIICYLLKFDTERHAYKIVQTLLEAGADPSVISDDGYTALELAKQRYSQKVFGLIEACLNKKQSLDNELHK